MDILGACGPFEAKSCRVSSIPPERMGFGFWYGSRGLQPDAGGGWLRGYCRTGSLDSPAQICKISSGTQVLSSNRSCRESSLQTGLYRSCDNLFFSKRCRELGSQSG